MAELTLSQMRDIANNRMSLEEASISNSFLNQKQYTQYKEVTEELFKEANGHIKKAQEYKKADNSAAAKKELDKAITKLKQGMKEADKIEDDNFFIGLIEAGAKGAIGGGLAGIIGMVFGVGSTMAIIYAVAYMAGVKPSMDVMRMRTLGYEKFPSKVSLIKFPQNRAAAKNQIFNLIRCCEIMRDQM